MNETRLDQAKAALGAIVDEYQSDSEAYMAFIEDPSLIEYIGDVLAELERTRETLRPMIAGYRAGDRGATLKEWMEGGDWLRLWNLIADLASVSPDEPACEHDWWSANNEVVANAAICLKCNKVVPADALAGGPDTKEGTA